MEKTGGLKERKVIGNDAAPARTSKKPRAAIRQSVPADRKKKGEFKVSPPRARRNVAKA